MVKYLSGVVILLVALAALVPSAFCYAPPTQDQIKKLIVEQFYPPSQPDDVCKTTLDFKQVRVAAPNALSSTEAAWSGSKAGKVVTPVQATFRVIQRVQMDAKAVPAYTIKEITQVYNYSIDEFGKPGLAMISHSANREKTVQYNSPTPPGAW